MNFFQQLMSWPRCADPRLDCVHWSLHSDALVSHKFLQQHLITADPAHSETGKKLSSCLIHTHLGLNCHKLSKFKRQKLLKSSAFLRSFPVCIVCVSWGQGFSNRASSPTFSRKMGELDYSHACIHTNMQCLYAHSSTHCVHLYIHMLHSSMIQWLYMYCSHARKGATYQHASPFSPHLLYSTHHSQAFPREKTWATLPFRWLHPEFSFCVRTSAFDKGM